MTAQPQRRSIGSDHGQVVLRTYREGMASSVGHDLAIEVTRWSGELTVADELSPSGLEVRLDLNSLAVREGTGGVKPLTDKDRREIAVNAGKTLRTDRHPEATFTGGNFEQTEDGWLINGTFTLAGQAQPLPMRVQRAGDDRYRFTTSVTQSAHGIKPYSGFFGALKVRDAVDVQGEVDLSGSAGA